MMSIVWSAYYTNVCIHVKPYDKQLNFSAAYMYYGENQSPKQILLRLDIVWNPPEVSTKVFSTWIYKWALQWEAIWVKTGKLLSNLNQQGYKAARLWEQSTVEGRA